MGEIAASVLLKLFINYYKRCHTTYVPYRRSGTLFSNVQHIIYDHREQRNIGKINLIKYVQGHTHFDMVFQSIY